MKDGNLMVPDDPIIPFIEGDGTGPDIWRASQRVFDAAVDKAFSGKRKVAMTWKQALDLPGCSDASSSLKQCSASHSLVTNPLPDRYRYPV